MSTPAPVHRSPKHRRPTTATVVGWTRWPKHRDDTVVGPAAADGMEESQRQWVAAMRVRAVADHRRAMAGWS